MYVCTQSPHPPVARNPQRSAEGLCALPISKSFDNITGRRIAYPYLKMQATTQFIFLFGRRGGRKWMRKLVMVAHFFFCASSLVHFPHESRPQPSRLRERRLSPRKAFAVAYCKRPVSRPMYGSSTYICRSVSSDVQQAGVRTCYPVSPRPNNIRS